MTILDHISLAGLLKKASSTSSGEYAGPCPWCGGTDRFRCWPDHPSGATGGRFLCRACGRQGDGLAFLMEHDGLSYPEACRHFGTTPTSRPAKTRQVEPWTPKAVVLPGEKWITRATAFVDRCAAALAAGGPGLGYAMSRGLTLGTCAALKIGWNDRDTYEDREAWGLSPEVNPETGKPRKVWLPAGLVIPTTRDGNVVAVKIRRAGWTPEDRLPKYAAVASSAPLPFVLAPAVGKPCLVVESELDAILVAQEARDIVCAIALRTARGRPDAEAHALLKAAPRILAALDFDRAGAEGWPWWRTTYSTARRWPPLAGKDPGDMAATPGLIRAWIQAGLSDDPAPAAPQEEVQGATSCREPESAPAPSRAVCEEKGCAVWVSGGRDDPGVTWRCAGAVVHGEERPEAAAFPRLAGLSCCAWLVEGVGHA